MSLLTHAVRGRIALLTALSLLVSPNAGLVLAQKALSFCQTAIWQARVHRRARPLTVKPRLPRLLLQRSGRSRGPRRLPGKGASPC